MSLALPLKPWRRVRGQAPLRQWRPTLLSCRNVIGHLQLIDSICWLIRWGVRLRCKSGRFHDRRLFPHSWLKIRFAHVNRFCFDSNCRWLPGGQRTDQVLGFRRLDGGARLGFCCLNSSLCASCPLGVYGRLDLLRLLGTGSNALLGQLGSAFADHPRPVTGSFQVLFHAVGDQPLFLRGRSGRGCFGTLQPLVPLALLDFSSGVMWAPGNGEEARASQDTRAIGVSGRPAPGSRRSRAHRCRSGRPP